ncbi:heavy-metal-associated domain-containing protein [Halobacillus sp. B23F22_1]|uniref:heavy-metal-associated domain-containing protein n=1 Tax=Halobacillus sp. B23F22_1 TaxID=3459514 RepID=UPI00373EC2C1
MKEMTLKVKEITGPSDKDIITDNLAAVWGVRSTKVNAPLGEVTISYNEEAASRVDIEQAVKNAGFTLI